MRAAAERDRARGVGFPEVVAGGKECAPLGSASPWKDPLHSSPSLLPPARAIAAGLGMDHWASSGRARGEGAGRKALALGID